ncbi:TlpA family protein disulfide reductase [Sphingomonas sp. S1-29]|uniref:TlpA disulfide reductase family protein n=1 Tax=Sphingomonas sp. S1-29 TaxID=2991074 RepID=UPI00223F77D4|nr:TlpA disulfide reductase family protein [Sphingomonas sp. S1-29]UZK70601.1 TlpA family protein disulfide reductase [Sphingomonas sp. S1-29]
MIEIDRALALIAIWAFLSAGTIIAAQTESRAGRVAWIAVGIGIVAARAGFIFQNMGAFLVEPWTIIALWQGGFMPWLGIAATAATVIVTLGRQPATAYLIGALIALSLTHVAVGAATATKPKPLPSTIVLRSMAGAEVALDTMRGQPFVLNLWATWCPPCRRELPMLMDVAGNTDVPVLLVNQGEPAGRVRAFLSINDLPGGSVILDTEQRVAAATGARAFPTTLFVNADGEIARVHTGEISRAALTAAIRDLERATL